MAYHLALPRFEFKWHYHPEYELTLILNGVGKRIVGDNHEDFYEGDLVLLGDSLPHTWISNSQIVGLVDAIVIQFSEKFIAGFLLNPEFEHIRKLLQRSVLGLHYSSHDQPELIKQIRQLPEKDDFDRALSLLRILNDLSQQKATTLASLFFQTNKAKAYETRINTVCRYLQDHFADNVSLQQAAELVSLSESAFCRFFKKATGKTFSDYVNELRVGHACHLLTTSDKPVAEIALHSGFETLTYFNRIFLQKKKMRPKDFRRMNNELETK